MNDILKFSKDLEKQRESFEKDYKASTGEKFAGILKFTGSYVCKAKTVKYKKDGEIKQFPDIRKDQYGGFGVHLLMEVVKGTKNVKKETVFYISFPISSQAPNAQKKKNAANLCKGRMLALAEEKVANKFKVEVEWLTNNILGEFKDKAGTDDNFDTIRETKLNDLVLVEIIQDYDNSGRSKLKDSNIRKATPEDISIEGPELKAVGNETESNSGTEEQQVEESPNFSNDEDEKIVNDTISDFG